MNKYQVTVFATVIHYIDAESEEEAKEVALKDTKDNFDLYVMVSDVTKLNEQEKTAD